MKKIAWLTLGIAVTLLLASPALAGEQDKLWDLFDEGSGSGQALIWLGDDKYAIVDYTDSDGSGSYTRGDVIVRIFYIRLIAN